MVLAGHETVYIHAQSTSEFAVVREKKNAWSLPRWATFPFQVPSPTGLTGLIFAVGVHEDREE